MKNSVKNLREGVFFMDCPGRREGKKRQIFPYKTHMVMI